MPFWISLWEDLNLIHDLEVLGVALVSWRVEFDLQSMKYLEERCQVRINNQLHCLIVKMLNIILIDGAVTVDVLRDTKVV